MPRLLLLLLRFPVIIILLNNSQPTRIHTGAWQQNRYAMMGQRRNVLHDLFLAKSYSPWTNTLLLKSLIFLKKAAKHQSY
jgi:hypothetical protein